MKIKINKGELNISILGQISTGLSVVFCFNRELLTYGKKNLLKASDIPKFADLKPCGATYLISNKPVLLLSLGKKSEFNFSNYLVALKELASYIEHNENIRSLNFVAELLIARRLGMSYADYIENSLFHLINYLYSFNELKSKSYLPKKSLSSLNIISVHNIKKSVENALGLIDGMFMLKHLANNPSNIVTPSYIAEVATKFSMLSEKVTVEILNRREIKRLKMHGFLAVAKGSEEDPKFITLEYRGNPNSRSHHPIVLIGKGITFDSGGISLKPSEHMDEMKYDMCGAATVIGVFLACVKLNLPLNLVVLVPSCENMPSGSAVKPGDVVKTMDGLTVEILNTDAEGRLILCDALTYAKRYFPSLVIDVATLTGSCVIALGNVTTGLFSNDDELANKLLKCATKTGDKAWRLPLFDEYHEMLKSKVADIANISSPRGAGAITAACFLEKFASGYNWAHLDIAGTAMGSYQFNGKDYKGASGRPFMMLMEFLRNVHTTI